MELPRPSEKAVVKYFAIGTATITVLLGVFLMFGGVEFYVSWHGAFSMSMGTIGSWISALSAVLLSGTGARIAYSGVKAVLSFL